MLHSWQEEFWEECGPVLLGHCQGRISGTLTVERLLGGKLRASPLAYRQNMFLSGAGSPWSLMTLLLLLLLPAFSLFLSVFFFFFFLWCYLVTLLPLTAVPWSCLGDERLIVFVLAPLSKSAFLDVNFEQLCTLFDLFVFKGGEVVSRPITLYAIIYLPVNMDKFTYSHEAYYWRLVVPCSQLFFLLFLTSCPNVIIQNFKWCQKLTFFT